MEQPLDLSQREQTENTALHKMETGHVICPFVNCNCPLKHIPPLDARRSPHFGHMGHMMTPVVRAPVGYLPGFYSDAMLLEPNAMYLNKNTKFNDSNRHSEMVHPKRRKLEEYSQETTSKSVTEENSSSKPATPKMTFFRPGFPLDSSESSSSSTSSLSSSTSSLSSSQSVSGVTSDRTCSSNDDKPRSLKRSSPSISSETNDIRNKDNNSTEDNISIAQRERSKTISYMERLPKKRIAGRHWSQDTSQDSSSIPVTQAPVTSVDPRYSPSSYCPTDGNPSLNNCNNKSPSSSSVSVTKQEATGPKIKAAYDVSSLKADMIREIDEAEKLEKNTKRQKTTYIGYGRSSPNEDKPPVFDTKEELDFSKNPGGVRMTALDYLISKTLLQREDKPYKARNHHIHQIIRGEKPGKLCLMDIVELQVEIGLA